MKIECAICTNHADNECGRCMRFVCTEHCSDYEYDCVELCTNCEDSMRLNGLKFEGDSEKSKLIPTFHGKPFYHPSSGPIGGTLTGIVVAIVALIIHQAFM